MMAFRPLFLVRLSDAYRRARRTKDAAQTAGCALELAQANMQRGYEAWTLCLLGEIALHLDLSDIDQVETYCQQALALAKELGIRPLQARCHRALGNLYRQTGRSEQACTELSTAIEMYRDVEMTFWLPEAETVLEKLA